MFDRMFYVVIRTPHKHYAQYGFTQDEIVGSLHDSEENAIESRDRLVALGQQADAADRAKWPTFIPHPPTYRVSIVRVSELVDVEYNSTPVLT